MTKEETRLLALVKRVGMGRTLSLLIEDLGDMPDKEPYLWALLRDLVMTQRHYETRYDGTPDS